MRAAAGGGALGAYQDGVYQALAEAAIMPNWVAGISIGAINASIIVGNAPQDRVAALREFWEGVTEPSRQGFGPGWDAALDAAPPDTILRRWLNSLHAANALFRGVPGFFEPRFPPPYLQPPGTAAATSYYDTSALRQTLLALVDFDRINADGTRLSLGAVNVRSGNFVYFDTRTDVIRPEHVMASGALSPGFPAIEIDGEQYWDGGLVSNTPLQWVAEHRPFRDTIAFQIDLWSARGALPREMSEVMTRWKEIQYSSRTRVGTDQLARLMRLRGALRALLPKLDQDLLNTPEGRLLAEAVTDSVFRIVHLIYRPPPSSRAIRRISTSRGSRCGSIGRPATMTRCRPCVTRPPWNGRRMRRPSPSTTWRGATTADDPAMIIGPAEQYRDLAGMTWQGCRPDLQRGNADGGKATQGGGIHPERRSFHEQRPDGLGRNA